MRAELLRKELGIVTYGDLLQHFPYRYLDSAKVQHIGALLPGQDYVQLQGMVINLSEEGQSFRRRLTATLYDKTGRVELVWFQGINFIAKSLQPGATYSVFGKLTYFNGLPTITHPEIELYNAAQVSQAGSLQPVYPTTEKLRAKGLSNRAFAKVLQSLLEKIKPADIPELLPPGLLLQYKLYSRFDAYMQIHFPQNEQYRLQAERRLKWDELLFTQLRILKLKINHHQQKGFVFGRVGDNFNNFFEHHLPFQLTHAQKRVLREIRQDTFNGVQMNRLVQGDVGSGKTIVAMMAMLLALDNGFQASLMAPTEILAQQHFQGIKELLEPCRYPLQY